MPEGHTIHRLARALQADLAGDVLRVSSPQGRFTEGAARLDGRRLDHVEAWGKHLFLWFGAEVLHVHLGLFGRWRRSGRGEPPAPKGLVRARFTGRRATWDLSGPTACAVGGPDDRDAVVARLGPDLLRDDADPERAWRRISRSRAPIGVLVMDQSVMAGVGNVYRAEGLHACSIDPERPGREVTEAEFACLWGTLRAMLRKGVEEGRIDTAKPDPDDPCTSRQRRRSSPRTNVYGQGSCRSCGSVVSTYDLAARKVWACTTCQR